MNHIRFSVGIPHIAFPLCVEAYTVREELMEEDRVIYYSYCSITVLAFNIEVCVKRKEFNLPPVYDDFKEEELN